MSGGILLSRRTFLQATALGTTALAVSAAAEQVQTSGLIDTNVSVGAWPFRHHRLTSTSALVEKLRGHGVTEAWASSFEALLHKDISSVNARLAEECGQDAAGLLVPIGAINPMLPGWEDDLRRCAEMHRMPGIRLHSNYHGYKLSDPVFERLLTSATELGLFVQIAIIMEEERTIHPLVNVSPVDTVPLIDLLKVNPRARVQLLNAFRTVKGEAVLKLAAAGVRFEIAMLEGVNGVANLLEKMPLESLCFGSHAPFFYFESAKLKLQESELGDAQHRAVSFENARRFRQIAH
ncbi:MAG TPA: amidohydrolase family protein [Planctomycetaceae bacterium]|nr:amidohydrolase family protein [Planctomycetaceae bacterium]